MSIPKSKLLSFVEDLHAPGARFDSNLFHISPRKDQLSISLKTFKIVEKNAVSFLPEYDADLSLQAIYGCIRRVIGIVSARLVPTFSNEALTFVGRPVASGGAMYPNSIFVVIPEVNEKSKDFCFSHILEYQPEYDNFFASKAITNFSYKEKEILVVVSVDFSKTYRRYGDFCYRLSNVDSGIVINRLWDELSEYFSSSLELSFNSVTWNSLLNLEFPRHTCALIRLYLPNASYKIPSSKICKVLDSHAVQLPISSPIRRLMEAPAGEFNARRIFRNANIYPERTNLLSCKANGFRRSRAQSFNGKPIEKSQFITTMKSMYSRLSLLQDGMGIPAPYRMELCVSVDRVPEWKNGLFKIDDLGRMIFLSKSGIGSIINKYQYIKSFDGNSAAFIVHIVSNSLIIEEEKSLSMYKTIQIVAGSVLDAGMQSVKSFQMSAHPFLGFDGKSVAREYFGCNKKIAIAQLCVGQIDDDHCFRISI